jgi:sulfoacetaldehyde dehydrogenase
MARPVTPEEKQYAQELLQRARCAMRAIEHYDQKTVDRLCQAVAWATANEKTATRLAHMGVDESGLGDRDGRPNKRFKTLGILRDALRQKSMGVIEEIPEKGIVKYAKPAGVIASIVPVTMPRSPSPATESTRSSARTRSFSPRIPPAKTRPSRRSASCAPASSATARRKTSSSARRSRASRWPRS